MKSKKPLISLWCQLRGSPFCPVDGLEMRAAYLKMFKVRLIHLFSKCLNNIQKTYDEAQAGGYGKLEKLSKFFDYLCRNYFGERAVYPAPSWAYYDPNSDGLEAESTTNNAVEILNSQLNSLIPNARLKFSTSISILSTFHRKAF